MTYKRYLKKHRLPDCMDSYRAYVISQGETKKMSEHDAEFYIDLTYRIRFGCKQKRVFFP